MAMAYNEMPYESFEVGKEVEATCLELALEGERLCKSNECQMGIQFFEMAVQVGTDDLKTLSAIYSQLGNAHFYLHNYAKALEYHKLDLNLARRMSDKLGEAKASGNLGNTLKVMGKFEEAVVCCQRHLDIAREVGDKLSEARALYNLGNVFHVKGKHSSRIDHQDPGNYPIQIKEALEQAERYYAENLNIVRELNDKAAEGRTYGNLGNTHYLLGNYNDAIYYHSQRLAFAKEFGDKSAERRAYSNLGNAHMFLAEFETAITLYKNALHIVCALADKALEAQSCYSLGTAYTLLRDYPRAIKYHSRHLRIAQELGDRVGEGRACWSLSMAHNALGGARDSAIHYTNRYLHISEEIGDETGKATAQQALAELGRCITSDTMTTTSGSESISLGSMGLRNSPPNDSSMGSQKTGMMNPYLQTNRDGNLDSCPSSLPAVKRPCQRGALNVPHHTVGAASNSQISPDLPEEDDFFSLLSKYQSRRMDEQRCSFRIDEVETADGLMTRAVVLTHAEDAFLDLVAGVQGCRMNDQRAALPTFPGLKASPEVLGQLLDNKENKVPDDAFFDMLMRCQATRIDDQRSSLPDPLTPKSPTVPDEDFFTLITRLQGSRLEEQRCNAPIVESVAMDTNNHTLPPTTQPQPPLSGSQSYPGHLATNMSVSNHNSDTGVGSMAGESSATTSNGAGGGGGILRSGRHSSKKNSKTSK